MPNEIVPIPQPVRPPLSVSKSLPEAEDEIVEVIEEDKPQLRSDELSDLFEVPQENDNDMYTDDLFELDGEDDLSDLMNVSHEDVMGGEAPKRKPRYKIVRRPVRRYIPPSGGMSGVRG